MGMEHELPGVLDGIDEPVSVEELEGVVRRAGQRRRARLAAGAAGLLLLGALGGALARGPGDDRPTGFAASRQEQPPTPIPPDAVESAIGFGMGPGGTLTPLFRREANGVAIRVYQASWMDEKGGAPPCAPPKTIQGELSNPAAVGIAFAPVPGGDESAPVTLLGTGMFGQEEGEPVTWAIVRTGPGVATVRFKAGDGTDTMAPQNGIALLAVPGTSGGGQVDAIDAAGSALALSTYTSAPMSPPPMDPACMPKVCMSEPGQGPDAVNKEAVIERARALAEKQGSQPMDAHDNVVACESVGFGPPGNPPPTLPAGSTGAPVGPVTATTAVASPVTIGSPPVVTSTTAAAPPSTPAPTTAP